MKVVIKMNDTNANSSKKIFIIGSGIAGLSAAKSARSSDLKADITIITMDSHPPYYRLRLCELIGREFTPDSFYIHPVSWYAENNITLLLSHLVKSIDPKLKVIVTDKGIFDFDTLIVASGSKPVIPPCSGVNSSAVHSIWNVDDITKINADLKDSKSACVIGGGLLGLETAYMINKMGISTTLIEGMPWLLPKQLDKDGADVFEGKVKSLGLHVITGKSVKEFRCDETGHVRETVFEDGQSVKSDIVIVSVGVRPNTELCADSGVLVDRFIPVNEKMQTNYDFIYAAGDVSSYDKKWSGQWIVASQQGQVAGVNSAGITKNYEVQSSPYTLTTMESKIVVAGDVDVPLEIGAQNFDDIGIIKKSNPDTFSYVKLIFKHHILSGGILVGDAAKNSSKLQTFIKNAAPLESVSISEFL
jgi:nitrite reductase (NADH) large subunit